MRDILLVTMGQGEEQAQLGEQPQNYDAWTRPNGAGLESLGQRLARELAAGTDIDAQSDTEYTECVEQTEFIVTIATFASDKDEAAKETRQHTDGQAKQPFRMDWSCLNMRRTGASVA